MHVCETELPPCIVRTSLKAHWLPKDRKAHPLLEARLARPPLPSMGRGPG